MIKSCSNEVNVILFEEGNVIKEELPENFVGCSFFDARSMGHRYTNLY